MISVQDFDPGLLGPEKDTVSDRLLESIRRQLTDPPPPGTLAADLTNRDRVALALHAGAPYRMESLDGKLYCHILVLFAVTDREAGGYYVAIGPRCK